MSWQKMFMFITVGLCITLVQADGESQKGALVKPLEKISLFELFSRSADLILRNPEGITKCTEDYKEKLTEITKEYEEANKECSSKANSKRDEAEKETVNDQKDFAKRTDSVCENVGKCKDKKSSQAILECFANEGSESSKALGKVSNDAKKISLNLNETLRRIDSEERTCMAGNKLKFESASEKATDDLNTCMFESLNPPVV
ncbi:uncharacterized protein LOC106093286 [Stomoxys calcitrans]|uniref:Protein TsetseEP domain-containing protein n=1 Tax=Stomoxys calcitrans TaxID=35570 RepID=A0A1I8Q0E2_STOCA|nr:uncharacterized protein LOC106093286 [Stomoxys calcitrans]